MKDLRVEFETEAGVLRAVDGAGFHAEPGETLGIVGESGCGKSVTAHSIMRLVPTPPGRIVGGEILWKGRDLLRIPQKEMPAIRGSEIAMIFQDPMTSLNPVMTVERQMGEILSRRYQIKDPAERRRRMTSAISQVGIADARRRLSAYPHELSGGMKQRIMIAMALMHKPALLIADEPTTALDVTIQKQILFLMRELQKAHEMALILITHDLGVVAEVCDRVAVMYAGRVVERAGVYTIFESPRHHYTRGLIDSIPKRGLSKDQELPTIEGVVPSLIDPPKGCRFASRCPRAEERCRQEDPALREIAPGQEAACHFPLEPPA